MGIDACIPLDTYGHSGSSVKRWRCRVDDSGLWYPTADAAADENAGAIEDIPWAAVFVYAGDIWLANTDGSNVTRITAFEGVEADPQFSPNGEFLAFTGEYDGNTDVFVVSVNGGEPKRLTWHPGADLVRGWSPDGTKVIFASGRKNAPYAYPDQLWEVSLSANNPTPFILPRAVSPILTREISVDVPANWPYLAQRNARSTSFPVI